MQQSLEQIHSNVKSWLGESIPFINKSLQQSLTVETKRDRRDLVSNIDKQMELLLTAKINECYPTHQVLGEETANSFQLGTLEHLWIIDPIDGTANFLKQKDHFCILIAYYEQGIGKLGYMYDVVNEDLYHAVYEQGAYKNGEPIRRPEAIALEEGLVSCDARNWCEQPRFQKLMKHCFDIRYFGCGGIDSIHVIQGKFAAFLTSVSGPWDKAAQMIFAKELGLKLVRFDGSEVDHLTGGDYILANEGCIDEILSIMKDV
ncbi:inositol monophosphatase family protein [Bacillus suaedae]|uniref:Inositol monophosphatase family protein n=1 Tax=Halalkalibacter suaedae TaxID=2822140 RepID=A0A940WZ59_9BACI|nr:inositol monophosphatase family protein [Bacillus suaedae]MBP3953598.1 inositol monophosphatase family protein [Bacillus suaedae]